jgi:predicted small secreted protein
MKRKVLVIALMSTMLSLSACNTTNSMAKNIGKDVNAIGKSTQRAISKTVNGASKATKSLFGTSEKKSGYHRRPKGWR